MIRQKNEGKVGVKGTWLVDWAKMVNKLVKNNPEKRTEFDQYLTAEDWQQLKVMLIPSVVYPYDFFRRLGRSVFHVIAKQNLNATRAFGKMLMKNLLGVYKNLLQIGDPIASAKKLVDYHSVCFINVESKTSVSAEGKNFITILLTLTKEDKKFDEAAEAFAWQLGGQFEELVTQAGAKNVKLEIEKTKDNNYQYSITWQ